MNWIRLLLISLYLLHFFDDWIPEFPSLLTNQLTKANFLLECVRGPFFCFIKLCLLLCDNLSLIRTNYKKIKKIDSRFPL